MFQSTKIIHGCYEKYVKFRKENRTNIKIQNNSLLRFSSYEKSQEVLWEPECCWEGKGYLHVLDSVPHLPLLSLIQPLPDWHASWGQSHPSCVILGNYVTFPCLTFLTCKLELTKMSHGPAAKIKYEKHLAWNLSKDAQGRPRQWIDS